MWTNTRAWHKSGTISHNVQHEYYVRVCMEFKVLHHIEKKNNKILKQPVVYSQWSSKIYKFCDLWANTRQIVQFSNWCNPLVICGVGAGGVKSNRVTKFNWFCFSLVVVDESNGVEPYFANMLVIISLLFIRIASRNLKILVHPKSRHGIENHDLLTEMQNVDFSSSLVQ